MPGLEVSAAGLGICEIVLIGRRDKTSGGMIASAGLWLLSDVRAAALAEVCWARAKGADHVLPVAPGTGIASALVIGGIPHAGVSAARDCCPHRSLQLPSLACADIVQTNVETPFCKGVRWRACISRTGP